MIDESIVGYTAPAYEIPVERGKILELARSLHLDDPAHVDRDAANARGYADVVAPLTFSTTTMLWATADPSPNRPVFDLRNVVAAGAEWEYLLPIVAGDVLRVEVQIVGVERKVSRRGPMTLLTREHTFTNQRDEVAMKMRAQLIEFDPKPATGEPTASEETDG
jgi:acyl dehydratase